MSRARLRAIRDYRAFVESLHKAHPRHYLGQPHSRIRNEDAFKEMHEHLVKIHAGVEPKASFRDANGAVFDCIPIEQQISLRGRQAPIAKPPRLPSKSPGHPDTRRHAGTPPGQLLDPLPAKKVPAGTIPVRRQTMAELAGYGTLRNWLGKRSPIGKGNAGKTLAAQPQKPAAGEPTHWYAYGSQGAKNIGGGSTLNVWDPAIGAGQNMSLSQLWFTDASHQQTVEVGWQVNPRRYGGAAPVLFVYWTADGYATTGCYNLGCQGFVQTNGGWALGGALSAWSAAGGRQVELTISVLLDGGKWWLYVNGDALGYYPASIYKGGPLTSGAAQLLCGGEVAGTASAPPMGSGAFAKAGWQHAAYQRDIHSFGARGSPREATLAITQPSRRCFTAKTAKSGAPWGTTLWFGGPGSRGGGKC